MNILHLSNVGGRVGAGVSQVVNSLIYFQQNFGYSSDLWFMGTNQQIDEIHFDSKIEKNRINVILPLFGIKNTVNPLFFLKRYSVSKKYKIIHQHGIFLPISIFTRIIDKDVKKIINTHGYLEPEKLKVSTFKKKIALFFFENSNLMNCNCLVACSEQEAFYLKKYGIDKPIVIIPNGINDSFIKNDNLIARNNDFRLNNNIGKNNKILLFLSRIHPFKGLKLLIESISLIKDKFLENSWVFVIAGPDELNHRKELDLLVKKNNLEKIIFFVGPLYGIKKIDAFDAADCFILPSKAENFGISIIEALARGVPVITTKNTPWNELNINNCGWWINRERDEFVRVLLELFSIDQNNLNNMGKNGIDLVRKKYTWSRISKQYIKMYEWVFNDFNNKYNEGFKIYQKPNKL